MKGCFCQKEQPISLTSSMLNSEKLMKFISFKILETSNLYLIPLIIDIYSIQPGTTLIEQNSIQNQKVKFNFHLYPNIHYHWIEENSYLIKKEKSVLALIHIHNINSKNNLNIIYSHGGTVTLGTIYPLLIDLSTQLKCDIISYDYSGYGVSTGIPSESEVYDDIEAVIKFANNYLKIQIEEIILMGNSIGSVPTIHLASKTNYTNISGIVLISPIAYDLFLVFNENQNFSNKDKNFSILHKAKEIKCPIFIMHGKKDNIIPLEHSKQLIKSIRSTIFKWFPKFGKHNELIMQNRTKFFEKYKEFIEYIRRIYLKERISMDSKVSSNIVLPNEDIIQLNVNPIYKTEEKHKYVISNVQIINDKTFEEKNTISHFVNYSENFNSLSLGEKSN